MGGRAASTARRLLAAGLGTAILAVPSAGCGGDDDPAEDAAAADGPVEAIDFGFEPAERAVATGTTVTWVNTGQTIHTVKGPGFFSRAIDPGGEYRHRFAGPGKYRYLCTLHPETMRGTVVVTQKEMGEERE